MIRIVLILLIINSYLFSFLDEERYINGKYTNNLKVIWMNNNSKGKLQSLFTKAQNVVYQKLYKDNEFENIKNEQKADYRSVLAVLDDPTIYTDKRKLFEADMLDFYDNDLNDELVAVFRLEKTEKSYRLYGLKLFKDGDNTIVTTNEVNSYTQNITQKILENMIYFFIKSSIDDYESVLRMNAKQIVLFQDEKKDSLKIEIFKEQNIKRFITPVTSQDLELAQKLNLVKTKNLNQTSASEYCELLGMMLENKIFIKDGNEDNYYYYELLYDEIGFKDGRVVNKRVYDTNLEGREFRCVDAKDSVSIMPLKEYEIQNIGIRYRLNNKNLVHEDKIVATDIKISTSKDAEKTVNVMIADESGKVSLWKDNMVVLSQNVNIENIQSIALNSTLKTVTIYNRVEGKEYSINNNSFSLLNTIPIEQNRMGIFEIENSMYNSRRYSINSENYLFIDNVKYNLGYWPTHLAVSSNFVTISNGNTLYKYSLDENLMMINKEVYSGFKGEVTKLLYFHSGEYLLVGTSASELVLYKKDELKPIKIISNFGYNINDISLSEDDNYLVVANGDMITYVFELDVILNNIVLNQEKN